MSDEEFTEAVAAAGGTVIIGLKDPRASEGVDNFCRVLITTAARAEGQRVLDANGVKPVRLLQQIPAVIAKVPPDVAARLRRNPNVDYIEPSLPGSFGWYRAGSVLPMTQVVPWNVSRVGAPTAWQYSTGTSVKLAIIDSGVDLSHFDLAHTSSAISCTPGVPSSDQLGHGTLSQALLRQQTILPESSAPLTVSYC